MPAAMEATKPAEQKAVAPLVQSVLKPHLRDLAPYKPPLDGRDPAKHLLLDFNERTEHCPKHVTDALKAFIDAGQLQKYPAYGDLNNKIATYAKVKPEQCMFTNGSDQGIDMIVRSCCPQGTEAIIPLPTFAMYEQAAKTEGLVIKTPYFTREGGFPLKEVLAAVSPNTSLVVLSNPNNPTGTPIPREDILEVAKQVPQCAILVDECYYEFMPPECSVADVVGQYPNIFVTRTFSKTWGIPSLRLGYLISDEANIRSLCSVRGPYDVNQLAKVAVDAALSNPQYMVDYVTEVNERSKPKFEAFLTSKGVVFWPTMANFIFCYFDNPDELEAKLRERGILVRPKKDEKGTTGLRISFGTEAQMERVIAALDELLEGSGPVAKKAKTSA